MRNLSTIDLAMFLFETPERPLGVGPLVLLRPPKKGARGFANRLRDRMLEHQPGAPFNYRLNLSLTNLPSFETLKDVDLSPYVHRLTLKGNGSLDQLISKVCEIHESMLPRDGLLWEFYIIDGLSDGRIALYGKAHHGIIDGRGFVQAMTHWFSTDPADKEVRALWQGVPNSGAERRKESASLSVESLLELIKKSSGVLGSAAALIGMLAAQGRRHLGLGGDALDVPFVSVPAALSGTASGKRNFVFTTLPLDELKSVGKKAHATVNDVLLALLDGALDRYLKDQHSRPAKPLVVDMPVALPSTGNSNQIAVLQLAMGKPGATMIQRLADVRKETERVKTVVGKNSAEAVMLYTTLVHALPTLLERIGIQRPLQLSNLVFSNPFGLSGRQYLMGAEVETVMPMTVIPAGQMLNVTVVTLADQIQMAFLGMPNAIKHIDKLAQYTHEAFDALKSELTTAPLHEGKAVKASVRKRNQLSTPKRVVRKQTT